MNEGDSAEEMGGSRYKLPRTGNPEWRPGPKYFAYFFLFLAGPPLLGCPKNFLSQGSENFRWP